MIFNYDEFTVQHAHSGDSFVQYKITCQYYFAENHVRTVYNIDTSALGAVTYWVTGGHS